MRTKTYKPNYNLAESKAIEFLNKLEKKELPIKLIKFKNIYTDLEIKTYSWYSRKMGLTIEKVCKDLGSVDGCCIYNELNGVYRIYYNDTIENEGRKRWTIAHELGHYALKHPEIHGCSIIRRLGVPDEKYDTLEKEANCFARNLLAPPHIIFHLDEKDPYIIEHVCKVSTEAAHNIWRFLSRGIREYGIGYSTDYVEKLGFKDFLNLVNNRYYCKNCKVYYTIDTPSYCSCCGKKSLTKSIYTFGDEFEMKYPAVVEVDHKGRAKSCPRCQNEELDYEGNYCNVCSAYLVNECAGLYDYDGTLLIQSCGATLAGNARYCHKCGNPSTFLNNQHLNEWNYRAPKAEDIPFQDT